MSTKKMIFQFKNNTVGRPPYQIALVQGFEGTGENNNYFIDNMTGVYDRADIDNILKNIIQNGISGKSAYEIAVTHGYEGTEEEWLNSLKTDMTGVYSKSDVDNMLENIETLVMDKLEECSDGCTQEILDGGTY